jgi:hypothetical protein
MVTIDLMEPMSEVITEADQINRNYQMPGRATIQLVLMSLTSLIGLPVEASLSPSFCSEMRDAMKQMNAMLPQIVKSPSASFLENLDGVEDKVFLDTTYVSVDVDCEEEAVIYNVRFADSEVEDQLKADTKKADGAFYDMYNSQKAMACRSSGFIRKFGLKQEVRTLLDRSGDEWHRWVTSSYDCR